MINTSNNSSSSSPAVEIAPTNTQPIQMRSGKDRPFHPSSYLLCTDPDTAEEIYDYIHDNLPKWISEGRREKANGKLTITRVNYPIDELNSECRAVSLEYNNFTEKLWAVTDIKKGESSSKTVKLAYNYVERCPAVQSIPKVSNNDITKKNNLVLHCREIKFARIFQNTPGVIRTLDISDNKICMMINGVKEKVYTLNTELGETNLFRYINSNNPSEIEKREIAKKILIGLVEIHKKDVIHHDIKPDNIVMVKNPNGTFEPKIIDFGCACGVDEPIFKRIFGGTKQYMSPEYLKVDPKDKAAVEAVTTKDIDVYAMGKTFQDLFGANPSDPQLNQLIGKMLAPVGERITAEQALIELNALQSI